MFVRLNEEQATTILSSGRIGRLGCIVDGGPYVVPISYYFADGSIYSHSLPGLKTSALRENPKACLQVDVVENELRWKSALAFGVYEEVTKPNERGDILNKLLARFPLLTPVESAIATDAAAPPIIVYRIRVERITGMAEQ